MGDIIARWWLIGLVILLGVLVYLRARLRAEPPWPEPDDRTEPPEQPPASHGRDETGS
jgi:hypothetical protein